MKRFLAVALFATTAFAQSPGDRAAADAAVVDRVAEASKRDLPSGLLKRIVEEDIELLRGRRPDGSYEYARYERFEAARITKSASVQPRNDKTETIEVRGANVYRVIVEAPSRRMLVRKNRAIWVERVDVDYIAEGSSQLQQRSFEVKAWLQPGEVRPIDLPAIGRQVTARVIVTGEKDGGYANVDVALVQARIVDLATSPYAEGVTSAKALLRALEKEELAAVRTNAQRMGEALGGRSMPTSVAAAIPAAIPTTIPTVAHGSGSEMNVTATPDSGSRQELQSELQTIEDLLTGSEAERRQGLDRLHQLVRRMRQ